MIPQNYMFLIIFHKSILYCVSTYYSSHSSSSSTNLSSPSDFFNWFLNTGLSSVVNDTVNQALQPKKQRKENPMSKCENVHPSNRDKCYHDIANRHKKERTKKPVFDDNGNLIFFEKPPSVNKNHSNVENTSWPIPPNDPVFTKNRFTFKQLPNGEKRISVEKEGEIPEISSKNTIPFTKKPIYDECKFYSPEERDKCYHDMSLKSGEKKTKKPVLDDNGNLVFYENFENSNISDSDDLDMLLNKKNANSNEPDVLYFGGNKEGDDEDEIIRPRKHKKGSPHGSEFKPLKVHISPYSAHNNNLLHDEISDEIDNLFSSSSSEINNEFKNNENITPNYFENTNDHKLHENPKKLRVSSTMRTIPKPKSFTNTNTSSMKSYEGSLHSTESPVYFSYFANYS